MSYVFNKDAVTILKHPSAENVLEKGAQAAKEKDVKL